MDYDAPGNNAGSTRATAISMIALTTIAVFLRFWARQISSHAGLWWDDWLALGGWVFGVIEFSFAFPLTANGLGQHIGHVTDKEAHRVFFYVYVMEYFYNFSLTFMKLSALTFYVRIFSLQRKWFKWAVRTTGALVIAWMLYTTFLGAFQCSPPRKAWQPEIEGHCISDTAAYIATAAPNVVMDLMILLMPMPFLNTLQISKQRKFGLMFIFGIGYCVPALSIARTIQVSLLNEEKFKDFTWYTNPTAILFYLEAGVGLISICLPAIFYLLRALVKRLPKIRLFSVSDESMSIHGSNGANMGPCADPHDPRYAMHHDFASMNSDTISVPPGYRWSESTPSLGEAKGNPL